MSFTVNKIFTVVNSGYIRPTPPPANNDPYWSSVSLLLKGEGTNGGNNNTFLDSGPNNFTLTRGGAPTQGPVVPFSGLEGSGRFDGSADYLSIANNAAFNFGTGSFTVEGWFYATKAVSSQQSIITNYQNTTNGWAIQIANSRLNANLTGDGFLITSSLITTNRWYHFALSGQTGSVKLFLDGAQQHSTYTGLISTNSTSATTIGRLLTGNYFGGLLSTIRVLKGTALYTASFTPPTQQLTAITNTVLLTKFNNAQIIDNTGKNHIYTIGNSQISTSTYKYNSGSIQVSGSGNYLTIPYTSSLDVGSGPFTIEAWLRTGTTVTSTRTFLSNYTGPTSGWSVGIENSRFYVNLSGDGTDITSSVISSNTWYHVAISGTGGSSVRLYVDGVQQTGNYTAAVANGTNTLFVGRINATFDFSAGGWVDDFRITKGVARYTSNFTPPTSLPTS